MKRVINILLVLCFICLFVSTSYSIYRHVSIKKEIEIITIQSDTNKTIPEDNMIIRLREEYQNEDIVMRIVIDSLDIDSVIVRGSDNSYYLNHDLNKKKSVLGSIFMDYRNDIHDSKINIYGHNSRTYDVPFRKLEKYMDQSFYQDNSTFIIYDMEGKHEYEIFTIYSVKKNNNNHMQVSFSSADELLEYMNHLKQESMYDTGIDLDVNDKYLLLQTCLYDKKIGDYLIIVAKEIKSV